MIKNVVPQCTPLICYSGNGSTRSLVVGWCEIGGVDENGHPELAPVVVPLDDPGVPRVLTGTVGYVQPAG